MYFPGSENSYQMVSEPASVLMDAEFRNGVYNTLACHESRIDHFNNKLNQIHNTLQTLLTKFQSLRIPHNANTQTKLEIKTISSSSSMATDIEYNYNTPTHSSSRVTPFTAVYGVPNPKLLSYILGTTKVNTLGEILCDREDILADLLRNPFLAHDRMKYPTDSSSIPPISDASSVLPQSELVLDSRVIRKYLYRPKMEILVKCKVLLLKMRLGKNQWFFFFFKTYPHFILVDKDNFRGME